MGRESNGEKEGKKVTGKIINDGLTSSPAQL